MIRIKKQKEYFLVIIKLILAKILFYLLLIFIYVGIITIFKVENVIGLVLFTVFVILAGILGEIIFRSIKNDEINGL